MIQASFWNGPLLTCSTVAMAGTIVYVERQAARELKSKAGGGGETLQSLTVALLESEVWQSSGEVEMESGEPNGRHNNQASNNWRGVFDENTTEQSAKACTAAVESGVHITDIRKFGPIFWLLTLSCIFVYGCVLPFNNVASGILLERNFFTPSSSSQSCKLAHPNQCTFGYLQNGTNGALEGNGNICVIAPSQAPVLPFSVNHTAQDLEQSGAWEEQTYIYPSLTSKNVDCGDSFWIDACTYIRLMYETKRGH